MPYNPPLLNTRKSSSLRNTSFLPSYLQQEDKIILADPSGPGGSADHTLIISDFELHRYKTK